MNWLYTSTEYVTTAIEIMIYFGVIGQIAKRRLSGFKHWCLWSILIIGITCVIKTLNGFALYSYLTAVIWMVMAAGTAVCLYKYNFFSLLCIAVLYGVLINALDLIVLSIIEILFGFAGVTVEVMTSIDTYRFLYIIFMKILLVLLYFPFSKKVGKSFYIDFKTGTIIVISSAFCFLCMQNLLDAIVIGTVAEMRRGILVAWLFIVLFIVSILFLLRAQFKIESARTAAKVIEARMETIEQNHRSLNVAYHEISKITHDFKNHLRTISILAQNKKHNQLMEYLNEVAADVAEIQIMSYTSIDSIDAVINSKRAIARKDGISFDVDSTVLNEGHLRSADLCAIIANLLDNAIEACLKLDSIKDRNIHLGILSANSMLIVKCVNTYQKNSLWQAADGTLLTTKGKNRNHGYGLQIIKTLAEKYDGSFQYCCKDSKFIAIVMLSNNS